MNNLEAQSGISEVEGINSPSSEKNGAPDQAMGKTRRFAKLAALGVLGAALSACSAEGSDMGNASFDNGKNVENTEVQKEQPELQLQMPNEKTFHLSLFFATDSQYKFVVTSLDNADDIVEASSLKKDVQGIEGLFRNSTQGYKVEAFNENGIQIPIDGSGKEGTIYGVDVYNPPTDEVASNE